MNIYKETYNGVIRARKGDILMVEHVQAIVSTDPRRMTRTIEFERNHILKRETVHVWNLVQFQDDAVLGRFGRDLLMLDKNNVSRET